MPTESILVAIGVCVVFLLFAFVVAWVDHTTSRWLSSRATTNHEAASAKPSVHEAA